MNNGLKSSVTTDREFILGILNNSGDTLNKLYKTHFAMVLQFILNNNGDEDDAKDVYQEAIIVLYNKVKQGDFELSSKLKTYIYSVCRRIWLKKLTQNSKKTGNITDYEDVFEVEEDVEHHEEKDAAFVKMQSALEHLGEPCKTIIQDFYIHNLSMQDICEKFGYTNTDNAKNTEVQVPAAVKENIFSTLIEMRNDLELDAIIEDYLLGKLNPQETEAFEQLRRSDAAVDHKVVSHKVFLHTMEEYAQQLLLKEQLDSIHSEIDVDSLVAQVAPHPSRIVQLWRKHKSAIAVAASFIVLSFVSIYSIQHNSQQTDKYVQLSNQVTNAIKTQNNLIRKINTNNNTVPNKAGNPGRYGGTGFAISTNGYILTNLHVINGADSIYVQNSRGESFKVKAVYTDTQYDMAILKVSDKNFSYLSSLPYTIKRSSSSIGENVYTLGYPKDDAVLGEGYVSSKNGFIGDTTQYQVAIPVNPGNSGGPLLDNNGNLVGIISGKPDQTEGAAFAIKSKYILEAMRAIPQDSLGKKLVANKKSLLSGLKRTQQIEKLQDYVFMIKVY